MVKSKREEKKSGKEEGQTCYFKSNHIILLPAHAISSFHFGPLAKTRGEGFSRSGSQSHSLFGCLAALIDSCGGKLNATQLAD